LSSDGRCLSSEVIRSALPLVSRDVNPRSHFEMSGRDFSVRSAPLRLQRRVDTSQTLSVLVYCSLSFQFKSPFRRSRDSLQQKEAKSTSIEEALKCTGGLHLVKSSHHGVRLASEVGHRLERFEIMLNNTNTSQYLLKPDKSNSFRHFEGLTYWPNVR